MFKTSKGMYNLTKQLQALEKVQSVFNFNHH